MKTHVLLNADNQQNRYLAPCPQGRAGLEVQRRARPAPPFGGFPRGFQLPRYRRSWRGARLACIVGRIHRFPCLGR